MRIGPLVYAARKATGRSRDEVARAAGVSQRAVASLEAGKGSLPILQAVADQIDFRIAGLGRGETIDAQLRAARGRRKLSIAALAAKAGLSLSAIRSLERGKGHVTSLEAAIRVVAPEARVRKPEKANWDKGARDDRLTPDWLLDLIIEAFGRIALDPCASVSKLIRAQRHLTKEEDGLSHPWLAKTVFVNPPYSKAARWIEKSWRAWHEEEAETVIALLPVRTNSAGFHDFVVGKADIVFLRGRPRFEAPGRGSEVGGIGYGVMLAIWGGPPDQVRTLAANLRGTLVEAVAVTRRPPV